MTVLVVVASRHGGTFGIAETIADELCATGLETDLVHLSDDSADEGADPDPGLYEAVVLGSAVYGAHWLVPAARWAVDHRAALHDRPVWLFSSGPVTDVALPDERAAVLVEGVIADVRARGHRLFGGRVARAGLTPPELAVVTAFRVPDVDARNLTAARAWAREIAAEIAAHPVPAS
jgi:menaquinone-dependent protoporphyrinogen oxidase